MRGNYLISGNNRQRMTYENDILEVERDFETGSFVSHNGLLRAGTFYLSGDFKQWGDKYSFCATEKHLMVFNGKGNEKQKVYMQYRSESAFNNVRVDGTGYCSVEEGSLLFKSMTASILSGITEAVEEEWDAIKSLASSTEQQLVFLALLGLSVEYPGVGAILLEGIIQLSVTVTVIEIGDMLLSDADRYMKAKFVAKQATHLLILAATIKGIDKICETLKSREATGSLLNNFQFKGKFLSDAAAKFSLKELPEQKVLCEELIHTEAVSGLSGFYGLETAERAQVYDVLKTVAQEKESNLFEVETLLTKLSEEDATPEICQRWIERARTNLLTNTECTYEEICSYLKRLNKAYEKDFIENAN